MTVDERLALQIAEWQKKHQVADNDPALAVLELMRVYLQHAFPSSSLISETPTSYAQFRETIDQLQRTATQLKNYSMDLVVAVRNATQRLEKYQPVSTFALLLVALLSGAVGFLVCTVLK